MQMQNQILSLFLLALSAMQGLALNLTIGDVNSVYAAQNLVADGLMDYYNGNQSGETPGMFVYGYYWWEAGVAWGTMLDYGYYTGNDTYNELIKTSMLYQIGPGWDFMPANQTTTEGNDDQGFWGIAAMQAAEKNFSEPTGGYPGWLYLAQATFNTMAWRWDPENCGGGLRWQIFTWNSGYDYKNTVSNGCLFNLAARLARFTGNDSYVDWADKVWDWLTSVDFIYTPNGDNYSFVYDGAYIEENCTELRKAEWTYCYGLFMSGAAFLYNYTNDDVWLERIDSLWGRATVFFENGVMYEAACQPYNKCNTDQRSFKGIFSRFLGLTMLMAPSTVDMIEPYIITTAKAVAESCSGGTDGHTCGLDWNVGKWDGIWGLGEQICALDLLNILLIHTRDPPLTASTGASSKGDGAAGSNSTGSGGVTGNFKTSLDLTTKDKAGAGVITAVVLIFMLSSSWWMLI